MQSDSPDVVETLEWLASLAPTRLTGTADERKVQHAIADRLAKLGYRIEIDPFSLSTPYLWITRDALRARLGVRCGRWFPARRWPRSRTW